MPFNKLIFTGKVTADDLNRVQNNIELAINELSSRVAEAVKEIKEIEVKTELDDRGELQGLKETEV